MLLCRLIILLKLEVCSGPTKKIGDPMNHAEDPSAGVREEGQIDMVQVSYRETREHKKRGI